MDKATDQPLLGGRLGVTFGHRSRDADHRTGDTSVRSGKGWAGDALWESGHRGPGEPRLPRGERDEAEHLGPAASRSRRSGVSRRAESGPEIQTREDSNERK